MAVVILVGAVGVAAVYSSAAIGALGYKFYEYVTRKVVKAVWYKPLVVGSHQSQLIMRVRREANLEIKIVRPDGYDQPIIVETVQISKGYYAVKDALKKIPVGYRHSANVAVIILHTVAPHVQGRHITSGKDLRREYEEERLGLIVEFQIHEKKIHLNEENTNATKLLAEFLMKFRK